jgi:hypothetical protein
MADIALGGVQVTVGARRRLTMENCPHRETLTTTTNGLERTVCETCGNLSVRYTLVLNGPVTRESFARPADTLAAIAAHRGHEPMTTTVPPRELDGTPYTPMGAFALQERLHIRSRYESHPRTTLAFA